ncbi:MAG: hypothetical protein VR72_09845 [Clostridiaceae bacterium BRH_c20a]|nr:MAG: hypothetical protein VR72_09845 [Clostridiaceae bacterium BRH_c20a]
MSLEVKVQLKDLSWLGQAFENKSFISPLGDAKLSEFTNEDKQKLINHGIIKEDNTIKASYYPLLEILALADGFIDTTFKRGPIKARKQIICQGDKKVSVVYQGEEATITMPSNPKAMAKFIGEYMGKSTLTGSDLDLELPANEAFCLAVITDLYRKAVFSAYAQEEVFVYTGFTKDELLKASNKLRENSQNLAFHVFVINAGIPELTMEIIEEALNALIEKGLVKKENNVYRPVGEALLFAGNFLIFENIIEVVVGQVHKNNLYRSNFILLQAGPLDVLYLEKSKDNILMECLSPLKATELIATVLDSKPDIV